MYRVLNAPGFSDFQPISCSVQLIVLMKVWVIRSFLYTTNPGSSWPPFLSLTYSPLSQKCNKKISNVWYKISIYEYYVVN